MKDQAKCRPPVSRSIDEPCDTRPSLLHRLRLMDDIEAKCYHALALVLEEKARVMGRLAKLGANGSTDEIQEEA